MFCFVEEIFKKGSIGCCFAIFLHFFSVKTRPQLSFPLSSFGKFRKLNNFYEFFNGLKFLNLIQK